MKREELREQYLESEARYSGLALKEDRILIYLSILRFLCFIAGLGSGIYLFAANRITAGMVVFLAATVLFLFLLKLWSEHSSAKQFLENLSKVNSNEALAMSGDTSVFDPGREYEDPSHDFSFDIDLFGGNSIFQYLNRTVTGYGKDILAGWLAGPWDIARDVKVRQEIINELAPKKAWRHNFMASGMSVPLERESIESFRKWLEAPEESGKDGVRKILIWALPGLTFVLLLLLIAGVIHYSLFIIMILINLGYIASGLKKTNAVHASVSGTYTYLASMDRLLSVVRKEEFTADALRRMQEEVSGEGVSESTAVKKLGRIIQSFDSRLNLLVGFVLNAMLLWDFHCIRRLGKWKAGYRDRFPVWLGILGRFDAFSSLANYAFNNPGFVFPGLDNNTLFSASGLGHPLIDEDRRVCNDFSLAGKGSVCIITGANMAGKSTFLRTVAVNYILAMIGAPVCANAMTFNPVKLFTSMRTTDSLSGNESYFYAELKRLKSLKEKAENKEPVFFILDEILKGTNSADKSLGSRLFLTRLIGYGASGLIATHDISLGELEKEHPDSVFNMCFEIEIEGNAISFDYKLYPGITRKMNAALLMRQMGILE